MGQVIGEIPCSSHHLVDPEERLQALHTPSDTTCSTLRSITHLERTTS